MLLLVIWSCRARIRMVSKVWDLKLFKRTLSSLVVQSVTFVAQSRKIEYTLFPRFSRLGKSSFRIVDWKGLLDNWMKR